MQSDRRSFLKQVSMGAGLAAGVGPLAAAEEKVIQGFDDTKTTQAKEKVWTPVSDRKVKVGIVGYGVCRFGAAFGFQNHPNVEIVAVSDLFPDRCDTLAKICKCETKYPSLEELVKDDNVEAVFVATDAPSHAQHCIEVLNHGKHVACAVPAVYGKMEDGDRLYETVKKSGLNYMLFETSCYRSDTYAMRTLYEAGVMGDIIYAEGEYYHYMPTPIDSFRGWRIGMPPQLYPTHSNAYLTGVSGESFTEVSCMGIPCKHIKDFDPKNNAYKNPFGTEVALFRNSGGGSSRMVVSWDTPGYHGEVGRVRASKGSMTGTAFQGVDDIPKDIDLRKPPLAPSMPAGGHGGSHGYLCEEFITSILEKRLPKVHIVHALNMSMSGIVAHESAMRDGETMKIPQWTL